MRREMDYFFEDLAWDGEFSVPEAVHIDPDDLWPRTTLCAGEAPLLLDHNQRLRFREAARRHDEFWSVSLRYARWFYLEFRTSTPPKLVPVD